MKKNVVRIILIVGFCIGLIISLYPLISNIYSRRNQIQVINDYTEDIKEIDTVITDQKPSQEWLELLADSHVEVVYPL